MGNSKFNVGAVVIHDGNYHDVVEVVRVLAGEIEGYVDEYRLSGKEGGTVSAATLTPVTAETLMQIARNTNAVAGRARDAEIANEKMTDAIATLFGRVVENPLFARALMTTVEKCVEESSVIDVVIRNIADEQIERAVENDDFAASVKEIVSGMDFEVSVRRY